MRHLLCLLLGHRRAIRWADDDGASVLCCDCRTVRTNRTTPAVTRYYR